jgi:hypothetical protein
MKDRILALGMILAIGMVMSCHKNSSCIESAKLSSIIVGTWKLTEQMGWPYSQDEFENIEADANLVLSFFEDGSLNFDSNGNNTPGTYSVNDSLGTISITTNVAFDWQIISYSSCEFIVQLHSDEGVTKHKYKSN